MYKQERRYRIIIAILSAVIIVQLMFILARRPKKIPPPAPAITFKGKIAIVIDDWGYNMNNIHILDGIKYPLTASILPHLSYSHKVAEKLYQRGLEIILHLPMEPHEKYRLEKNTIMISMDEATIRNIMQKAIWDVGFIKGVSNHMGSRATEDIRTMTVIFRELKKKHLYFLDSFVSAESVCLGLARKTGIGFAQRDIFLDNEENPAYIRGQLNKLKNRAKVNGYAIGIGHDRRVTLETLQQAMPEIEKEGYKFVLVSDLLR